MFGLLHLGPNPRVLTDLQDAPLIGRESEGDSVPVVAILGPRPWTYDAQAQSAITDTVTAAAQAQAEAAAVEALADFTVERPQLAAMLAQALVDLDQEEARATQIQADMSAQITGFGSDPTLPATPTVAQLRAAVVTLATRDLQAVTALRDAALGAQRNITRTRRLIRLVAAQAGIPLP